MEVIATRLATSSESIDEYVKKTLLYHSIDHSELASMVRETLEDLEHCGLITKDGCTFQATLLGQAIVASSLTPEDGMFVHRELRKALGAFAMDSEMHVLYLFTPVQVIAGSMNWQIFRKEIEMFDESNLRAMGFIGLKAALINRMLVLISCRTLRCGGDPNLTFPGHKAAR